MSAQRTYEALTPGCDNKPPTWYLGVVVDAEAHSTAGGASAGDADLLDTAGVASFLAAPVKASRSSESITFGTGYTSVVEPERAADEEELDALDSTELEDIIVAALHDMQDAVDTNDEPARIHAEERARRAFLLLSNDKHEKWDDDRSMVEARAFSDVLEKHGGNRIDKPQTKIETKEPAGVAESVELIEVVDTDKSARIDAALQNVTMAWTEVIRTVNQTKSGKGSDKEATTALLEAEKALRVLAGPDYENWSAERYATELKLFYEELWDLWAPHGSTNKPGAGE